MISADLFDEPGYLRLHPDVQEQVARGDVESGYMHYILHGSEENRSLPRAAKMDDQRKKYFNVEFYRSRYGIKESTFDHYCSRGWRMGYMPNPLFCPKYYAIQNAIAEQEPLLHFLENWRTCPFVSPAFDIHGYLKHYSDVAEAHVEPFLHFISQGITEGRSPGFPLFEVADRKKRFTDFDWALAGDALGVPLQRIDDELAHAYIALVDGGHYRRQCGLALNDHAAAEHYAMGHWRSDYSPNPFFDRSWYVACHGKVGTDPIWHHLLTNSRPTPFFCAKSYLRRNADVSEQRSEQTAFGHFVMFGAREGRGLGLDQFSLSAVRKIEPGYDWKSAEEHYEFSVAVQDGLATAGQRGISVGLSPPRSEADLFQKSVILQKAQGKKVVSIDIWDTILRRSCDPDEVKFFVGCVLLRLLKRASSVDLTPVEVFRLRQWAEWRMADEHFEYDYERMVGEWLVLCGIHNRARAKSLAREVMEAEVEREIEVTRVDPTMLAVIKALAGTRKVAISDFYLPLEALSRVLAHHDLNRHFQAIYVSCSFMATKRSGALFDEVLRREPLDKTEMLHIGDCIRADYEVPLGLGIDSFHFIDRIEMRRKEYLRSNFDLLLAGNGAMLTDRALLEFFDVSRSPIPSVSDLSEHSVLPSITAVPVAARAGSVDLLALVFTGFGLFILEKALAAKIEKIFFATREGVFLQRVYDLLVAGKVMGASDYPDSKTIEVSRRATFAASLRNTTIDEMMRLWSMYSVQSMQTFGKSLNLDTWRLTAFCEKYELQLTEALEYPWQDVRVNLLFEDLEFQDWLSSESLHQRLELWAYLEKVGFQPSANVTRLFVDIGWRGSIQDNLGFLVNGRLEGVYLALYKYVAAQPLNVRKAGFLADHNGGSEILHLSDFAPLEFITNSCGGSVRGYESGEAIRDSSSTEEEFIATEILPLQDAILGRIERLIPVLKRSSLTWANCWELIARDSVRRYMDTPDLHIAEAFQALEHNETFGAGEIQSMSGDAESGLDSMSGAELHAAVLQKCKSHRWPQAWLRSLEWTGFFQHLSLSEKLMLPRLGGIVRSPGLVRSLGYKISIYAPEPLRGSGGHRTIYNIARALDVAGFSVNLFSERRGNDFEYKEEELAGSRVKLHDSWFSGIVPHGALATIQNSSSYLSEFFDDTVKKLYFIQDFEAEFNPVSDGYVRGQNSYAQGYNHICIGRWLAHRLRLEYGSGAASAGLGVDTKVYRPLADINRFDRIAVLFQPEKWRRLPEHCLDALAMVKARRPQTDIVFYGSRSSPNAAFPFSHLGLVNDLQSLNRLYNSARVGLCISLTNPSRIPYEMMATGCVPVDVFRYNNMFDYENGTALLAYQSAESLAEAMLYLLEHEEELAVRRARCISTAMHRTLEWETDAAVNSIEHVLRGGVLSELALPLPSYTDHAFVASKDDRKSVRAWCAWQRKLSNMKGEEEWEQLNDQPEIIIGGDMR